MRGLRGELLFVWLNHAAMTALVKVVSPAKYKQWLAQQSAAITAANAQVTQLRSALTAQDQLGE